MKTINKFIGSFIDFLTVALKYNYFNNVEHNILHKRGAFQIIKRNVINMEKIFKTIPLENPNTYIIN